MSSGTPVELPSALRKRRMRPSATSKRNQAFVVSLLTLCATLSIATTVGIVTILLTESFGFFSRIDLGDFLLGTEWTIGRSKNEADYKYGIWPLLLGTLRITLIAMAIAIPLGLTTAVYLSEYAPRWVRSILKPVLEILAGMPTVVLGYFAVVVITPSLLEPLGFKPYNAMSAGIAVGILCLPLVSSLAEDALQAVPRGLREAAYGLGGTRFDSVVKVVIPAAMSGIVSAFLLAFARAIGETMIVALAAGSIPTFTVDPRGPSQTMTGFIVEVFQSEDVIPGTIAYYSIYAVALTLFLLTFITTLIGQFVRRRYREAYE
ncbi:phosphate ABC transporter permease subunit PstC [Rosistilla oblonga]|nr:phosphate ABC transporter permease subunit PstC [Rosistilla oblonga]